MSSENSSSPNKGRNGKRVKMFIATSISLAILVALFWFVDFEKLALSFQQLNPWYAVLYVAVTLLSLFVRAYRWKFFLPKGTSLSFRALFDAYALGQLATFVLPLRAGEFVRTVALKRFANVPISHGLASVVLERLFDLMIVLGIFGFCISTVENAPAEVLTAATALGVVTGVVALGVLAAYFFGDALLKLFSFCLDLLFRKGESGLREKLENLAVGLLEGLRGISSVKQLLLAAISSLAVWATFTLASQIGIWAFGEFPSVWVGLLVTSVVALIIAVPSAPGFVGTYQAGCWISLSVLAGYSKEMAIAYAIVVHALQAALIFAVGLIVLHRSGEGFAQFLRRNQQVDDEETPELTSEPVGGKATLSV